MDSDYITLKCIRYGEELIMSDFNSYIKMIPITAITRRYSITQTGIVVIDKKSKTVTVKPKTTLFSGLDPEWIKRKIKSDTVTGYISLRTQRITGINVKDYEFKA